jgi:hypothetical protein
MREPLDNSLLARSHWSSSQRAAEVASWARIVHEAVRREADRALLSGEIQRAESFLPLISYTESLELPNSKV